MAHPHNFHQTYGFIGHLVQTRMRSHLQRLGALWQHLRRLNGKTFQAMVQLILWMNHDKSMGSPRNMACTNFRPYNLGKMTVLKHGLWRFSQHSRSPTHGIPELLTSISGPGPGWWPQMVSLMPGCLSTFFEHAPNINRSDHPTLKKHDPWEEVLDGEEHISSKHQTTMMILYIKIIKFSVCQLFIQWISVRGSCWLRGGSDELVLLRSPCLDQSEADPPRVGGNSGLFQGGPTLQSIFIITHHYSSCFIIVHHYSSMSIYYVINYDSILNYSTFIYIYTLHSLPIFHLLLQKNSRKSALASAIWLWPPRSSWQCWGRRKWNLGSATNFQPDLCVTIACIMLKKKSSNYLVVHQG